ncbi:MAG: trypsin-like peptidase domain-containing protein [Thermoanaerobaculia bacterium]
MTSRSTFFLTAFLATLLLLLGFAVGLGWRGFSRVRTAEPIVRTAARAQPHAVVARGDLGGDERATIELFKRASPSVTFITSLDLRRDLFSLNVYKFPRGTGSGFVWDERGHIVTNYHVIERSRAAQVTLFDHSSWDAELVGAAPQKDLAVLRIRAPRDLLRPIAVGRSRDLQVGQNVFAIGNPFGLDQTLTTGVISALGREIESVDRVPIRDVIQTDTAINPGNSGGPLLDSAGRLIGVNTAIYSPSGASAGIGFAIPVDTVNWVVPELIAKGRIERPTLGVELVSAQAIANLNVEGALIVRVLRGTGADRAGLRGTTRDRLGRVDLGDIIVEIEGQAVRSADDLILLLERYQAGDTVEVTALRDDSRRTIAVRLGPPSR